LNRITIPVALALASLTIAAPAQTARQCLTAEEAGGLVTYALPSTIKGLSKQCAKTLPATAALIQGGPILAARYQSDADRAWPLARQAFDKLAGAKMSEIMSEDGARALLTGVLESAVTQQVKERDCDTVDRLVNALQPLPARNMADLVIILMEVGSRSDTRESPFSLCKAPQG
jgi:hypothetical protein